MLKTAQILKGMDYRLKMLQDGLDALYEANGYEKFPRVMDDYTARIDELTTLRQYITTDGFKAELKKRAASKKRAIDKKRRTR